MRALMPLIASRLPSQRSRRAAAVSAMRSVQVVCLSSAGAGAKKLSFSLIFIPENATIGLKRGSAASSGNAVRWLETAGSGTTSMSKKFIAQVIQDSGELTGVSANRVATDLIGAIVQQMKREGSFTLPSFGTFRVAKTKARMGLNPATREPMKIKAAKTVRFKASKVLKEAV